MNAIVLVVDRLQAGCVGAYGNTWIDTPSLDRLAAEGFVFDQFLIDSPRLDSLYRSYWQGMHALLPPADNAPSLAELLSVSGIHTVLATDDVALADHPLSAHFDELDEIEPPASRAPATRIEDTHMARFFAQLVDWLEQPREPFLFWCHLAALSHVWDAPLDYRRRYTEPGDPEPPELADAPCRMLPEDHDPDEVLGITQCYAGQVSLLDTCLGALLEAVASSPLGSNTLIALLSARGYPLGEHRRIGACDEALYGELVHVPLFLRLPDRASASARTQALVHPPDLFATLVDCWGLAEDVPPLGSASLLPLVREEKGRLRDRLCLTDSAEQRAIRTPAWYLRREAERELYAKPDDRWEVNDVADRCGQVIEPLQAAMADYEQALRAGRLDDLPPLDDVLVHGLE